MQQLFSYILEELHKLILKNDVANNVDAEEYQSTHTSHLDLDNLVFNNYDDFELEDFISYFNLAPAENRKEMILIINEYLINKKATLPELMKQKRQQEAEFAKQVNNSEPAYGSMSEFIRLRRTAKEQGITMTQLAQQQNRAQDQPENDDEFDEQLDNQLDEEIDRMMQGLLSTTTKLGLHFTEQIQAQTNQNATDFNNSNNQQQESTSKPKINYWALADDDYFPSAEDEEDEEYDIEEDLILQKEVVNDSGSISLPGPRGWTRADADWFQALLLVMLHFVLGAQRKQILEGMSLDRFSQPENNGPAWIKPYVEKVPRPQTKEGIFVPPYAARLITYFLKNVRHHLHPNQDVVSVWINARGAPLQGGSYNNRIQKVMNGCFGFHDSHLKKPKLPKKKITPQIFRRLIPSLIFSLDIHPDGMSIRDFIANYARYVGTSEKIMWSHYIRSTANGKNQEINQIIHTIWLNDVSVKFGKKIDASLGATESSFQQFIATQQQKDDLIKELKEEIKDVHREIANREGDMMYHYNNKIKKIKQQLQAEQIKRFMEEEHNRKLLMDRTILMETLLKIQQSHPELIPEHVVLN